MDWKSLVKTVAPVLGTALGGPMAGAATKFIADKLLGNAGATEQDVADAVLGASADQLAKLRELDQTFKIKMRELDLDVFKMEVQDKASARELFKTNIWPQVILSGIYTFGYFAMLYMFMSGGVEVTPDLRTEFGMVLGVMTAAQVEILHFWFGSSQGSKEKAAELSAGRS